MRRVLGAAILVLAALALMACGGKAGSGSTGGSGGSAFFGGAGGGGFGGTAGSGASSGCSADSECTGAHVCDEPNQRCVECVESADCSGVALCVDNACLEPVSCSDSLDCVSAGADRKVCDPITELCVSCVVAEDCPDNNDCLQNRCVPYLPCVNSLECASGLVCDPATSRCVGCLDTTDCGTDLICAGGSCRPACNSDDNCAPLGLLCDRAAGYCVECIKQTDCAAAKHCSAGECLADACPGGARRCQTGGVSTCTAEGARWQPVVNCPAQTSCVQAGALAACEPWVCPPGSTECDALGHKLIECAADGLSVKSTDCSSVKVCSDRRCQPQLCAAGGRYCVGQEVRTCGADRLSYTVTDTCSARQFCAEEGAYCTDQLCSPNQPTCYGSIATTCNAQGSGANPGGTDCSDSGEFCSRGVCVDCQSTVAPAVPLPIDLFLMVDETASMGTDCAVGSTGTSRWCAEINGIYNSLNKSALAGTGVAVGSWGGSTTSCNSLSTPDAAYGLLPNNLAAVRSALDAGSPTGNSALEAAMRGVMDYTAANIKPNRNMVGVLFSDTHDPSSCETDEAVLAGLVAAHTNSTGIPFYWVGMNFLNSLEVSSVEGMAAGGGVTPHPDLCDAVYDTPPCTSYAPLNTATSIEAALSAIFKAEQTCEFSYPSGVPVERFSLTYAASKLLWTQTVWRVDNESQCDAAAGYYLNSASAPTSVTLCPQTCAKVRSNESPVINTVAFCN